MKIRYAIITGFLIYSMIIQSCSMEGRLVKVNGHLKDCSENMNTEEKITCYTRALKKDPGNALLYLERARAYRDILKFNSSMQDYMKVVELEPGNAEVYYALACVACLAYYKDKAVFWLKKALEAGFTDYKKIASDPSFHNLRRNREFNQLVDMNRQKIY